MSDVVIIGANGYLGRQLAFVLHKQGENFVAADIQNESADGYTNYIQVDVTDHISINKLPKDVSKVYMFAGLTGTKSDEESIERYTKVNVGGLRNVINHYRNEKVQLIFPSTRLVYKGVEDTYLTEDAEKEAKTIYAENKLACEQLLASEQKKAAFNYTVYRICVPYGNLIDGQYSYGTLGFFLGKATTNEPITLFGNGGQKRTFTHVKDIVDAMLNSVDLDQAKNNTYNIGSPDALSLKEVATIIANKYGVAVEHIEWPAEALKIESGDTIFADDKLLQDSNYKYQYELKNWVEELEL